MTAADAKTDLTWVLDVDRADGGVVVDGLEGGLPDYTRGQNVTLTLLFWDDQGAGTWRSGATFGGTHGATFGGPAGATFGTTRAKGHHVERYLIARQYLTHGGAVSVQSDIDGVPHVTDQTPASAPVDSAVVGIRAGDDYTGALGFWGAIMGGRDTTERPRDICRLELEVTVLAELDQFQTRADLLAAWGDSIA